MVSSPGFDVTTTVEGADVIVTVSGELDLSTAPTLRDQLHALDIKPSSRVVIDLSKASFVDSMGLGTIVGGLRRAREAGGDLVLRQPSSMTQRLLEVSGLDRVITVVP